MQPVFLAVLPGSVVRRLAALLSARVVVAFEGFVSTNRSRSSQPPMKQDIAICSFKQMKIEAWKEQATPTCRQSGAETSIEYN